MSDIVRREDAPEAQVLAKMEDARRHLAEARTLSQVKQVADGMAAVCEWLRRQDGIALALGNEANLIRLLAQRRMGEFLQQPGVVKGDGRPKKPLSDLTVSPPSHREIGITRPAARTYEQMASLDIAAIEALAKTATERGKEITQAEVLKAAQKVREAATRAATPSVSAEERPSCPDTIPTEFRNAVVVGDARELAKQIADASIALCLCDPVYERVEDYEWLARECERVLVPGGSLIVQCGNARRFDCEVAMRRSSLQWVDLLAEVYPYGICRLFKAKVFVGWKPYLWFSKGDRKPVWIVNRLKVGGKTYADESKDIHEWGDSEQFSTGLIAKLCGPGDVLWDPFTGSGTVPVAAAKLGVPFIAFEIDSEAASAAKQRVEATPLVPLPPVQMDLFDEPAEVAETILENFPQSEVDEIVNRLYPDEDTATTAG